jgi:hypothetical protein
MAILYSVHARDTAKHLGGDATFWGRLLAASVYLSGLGDEIDYIAPYPGHATNSAQPVISEALTILAKSLRRKYLADLIVRHTTAPKSQTLRMQGKVVDPLDQSSSKIGKSAFGGKPENICSLRDLPVLTRRRP